MPNIDEKLLLSGHPIVGGIRTVEREEGLIVAAPGSEQRLVLMRHGHSTGNAAGVFTGWLDPELTDVGRAQARSAARLLVANGCVPTIIHTSVLARAVATATIVGEVLVATGNPRPEICPSWRLNERHYGALQGLTRLSVRTTYGEDRYHSWRRSYRCAPPGLVRDDPAHPLHDPLYATVPAEDLPGAESLHDTRARLLPRWNEIAADVASGERVLVVAHGNSLRVLRMVLESLTEAEMARLDIEIATPMVYDVTSVRSPSRGERPLPAPVSLERQAVQGASCGSP